MADISHSISTDTWNHFALSLHPVEGLIDMFHNGKPVLSQSEVQFSLKKLGKSSLMVTPDFQGKVTEIRLWKRRKNEEDIKANMSTPLSIVSEKTALVIINIKKPGDTKNKEENTEEAPQPDFNFDFGLDATGTEGDAWDIPPPDQPDSPSQTEKTMKKDKKTDLEYIDINSVKNTIKDSLDRVKEPSPQKQQLKEIPEEEALAQFSQEGFGTSDPLPSFDTTPQTIEPQQSSQPELYFPTDQIHPQYLQEEPSNLSAATLQEALTSNDTLPANKFRQLISSVLLVTIKKIRSSIFRNRFDLEPIDSIFRTIKTHLNAFYTKYSHQEILKIKSHLRKFLNYRVLVQVCLLGQSIKGSQDPADTDRYFNAVNYALSLGLMDVDKTLLLYSVVGPFYSVSGSVQQAGLS